MWLERMKYFVEFIENLSSEDEQSACPAESAVSPKAVKVALIGDGVDGTHRVLANNIHGGKSFCVGIGPHNPVYSYFMPSGCNGTQMASLIRDVCPRVELYVVRLQELGGGGNRTLSAESAIKAGNFPGHNVSY